MPHFKNIRHWPRNFDTKATKASGKYIKFAIFFILVILLYGFLDDKLFKIVKLSTGIRYKTFPTKIEAQIKVNSKIELNRIFVNCEVISGDSTLYKFQQNRYNCSGMVHSFEVINLTKKFYQNKFSHIKFWAIGIENRYLIFKTIYFTEPQIYFFNDFENNMPSSKKKD